MIFQIENEYGNVISHYGEAGKAYINWCANMAESLNVGVPWIMCQESDAPQPMVFVYTFYVAESKYLIYEVKLIVFKFHVQINTCNGWYCDNFEPNNPNSPKMWTENWVGW